MTQTAPRRTGGRWALLYAGSAALLAPHEPLFDAGFDSEDHVTRLGEYIRRLLPDRSVLEINTDSAAAVEFTPSHRQVTLSRGEAYFQVNPHDLRSFDVYAGDVSVRAVHATFTVRTQSENTVSVYVSEGTVFMHEAMRHPWGRRPFALEASISGGHAARLRSGTLSIQSFSDADAICAWAWRSGQICLSGQTLSEAVTEINRYTYRKLVLGDASLANIRTGGRFNITRPSDFTDALRRTSGIVTQTSNPNVIVLLPGARPAPSSATRHHG